jgi:Holliday junction resolvase RusA-like endonuclease
MNKYVLPLPPTLNSTYRAAYRPSMKRTAFFMVPEAKDWKQEAQFKIHKRTPLMTGDVEVFVNWFLQRDRDIDSALKLVLDAFTGRVYQDDKQINSLIVRKERDKTNPRVEVEIFPLEE